MNSLSLLPRQFTWAISSWKDGRYPYRYLSDLEKTQFLPEPQIKALQWNRFKALLVHAYKHCPYYREAWNRVGICPDDIRVENDVRRLPMLTKGEIQRSREGLIADTHPVSNLIANQTGGSTGEPLSFFLTNNPLKAFFLS